MEIALALDGLLCDTESLKQEWHRRTGDYTFLKDEPFWVALQPYDDVREALTLLKARHDLYVFVERPKSLFLPTRAWLRRNTGVQLNKNRLIVPAIKRYDCRLKGIQHFIDSDPAVIENLKVETVSPIATYHVDRANGDTLMRIAEEL